MKNKPYWEKVLSEDYSLDTSVPANSRFEVIRELEAEIFRKLLPVFIMMKISREDSSIEEKLEFLADNLSKEDSQLGLIYKFGILLSEGRIQNPETISLEEFRKYLPLNKSLFSKTISSVYKILKDFFDSFKKKTFDAADSLAKNLVSSIRSISNNLFEIGIVDGILKGRNPEDVKVIKITWPGACKYCIREYTNFDGTPKVFTMRQLLDNGNDLYRRPEEYKPVIGCLHFNCRCTLLEVVSEETAYEQYLMALTDYNEAVLLNNLENQDGKLEV